MAFREELKKFLFSKFPEAKLTSSGDEVVIRCRFCGDSQNDLSSKHLYLFLGDESKPPMYHCFKCNSSGVLSDSVLRKICNCDNDGEMLYNLRNTVNTISKSSKHKRKNFMLYNVHNPIPEDTDLNRAKLIYINKRLGTNLSLANMVENKIVLSLGHLLQYNGVQELTRYPKTVQALDECFMGFLSFDNGCLNMRNLVYGKRDLGNSLNRRYIKYNIFNGANDVKNCYIIPTSINLYNTIRINISEGPFDILSVFLNLCGSNRNDNIYCAIGGKAYLNMAEMFISDMGIINSEFHIYIDNDIDDYVMQNLYTVMNRFHTPVYVHRNSFHGEKDFGVPLDRIQDSWIKL